MSASHRWCTVGLTALLMLGTGCSRELDLPPEAPNTGFISGTLVEALPGTDLARPVAGGEVRALNTNISVQSDASGLFVLGPLPKGSYRLLATGASAAGGQVQRSIGAVTVKGGATVALAQVALKQNAELAGRVTLAGQQLGNAGTTVFVPQTDFVTTTTDTGAWLLRQLPEGSARAAAFRPGFKPTTTPDLSLQGGTVTSSIDLVMTPETPLPGRVLGQVSVVDQPNSGGVTVRALSLTSQVAAASTSTTADGSFALDALQPDLYTLTFELPDRPVARIPNLAVGAASELHLEPVLLAKATAAAGNAQCTSVSQCDPGRLCLNGACSDCASTSQCGAGSSCLGGRCQKDCSSNADCAPHVCAANRCRACAAGAECADPALVCTAAGNCAHCQSRLDCPAGQACFTAGCGPCALDADCGAGATCAGGTCVAGACASNDGCPLAQACIGSSCASCNIDAECRVGQLCVSGTCFAGTCRTAAACSSGLVCQNYQCSSCAVDGDCGAGKLCLPTAQGKRCAPGDCRVTLDCGGPKAGQLCFGNTCTDCGGGLSCATGQVCVPQPTSGPRCLPGDCASSADCTGAKAGWLCAARTCTPCAIDSDCTSLGAGLVCSAGACIPPQCASRADCVGPDAGKVCRLRSCQACLPGDCNVGEDCTNGLCVPGTRRNVAVAVTGGGTVASSVGGISCASGTGVCGATYNLGDVVTLTAAPTAGFFFGGWTGAPGCGAALLCNLTITGDLAVGATFNAGAALTVGTVGPGTVTSVPAGLSCPGTCTASFPTGTGVTLTATPVVGYSLASWSGGGCGGAGSCAVTMSVATTVTATFAKQPVLAVSPGGPGSGTITSSPAGISCGWPGLTGTCSAPFPSGTLVTLTEVPAGLPFGGWTSGGCSGTATTCAMTLTADRTVGAAFGALFPLAVTVSGPGSVSADSGAVVSCGAGGTCAGNYASGSTVLLTATPQAGARLAGWGGDCAAAVGTGCTLAMTASHAASASFATVTSLSVVSGDLQSAPVGTPLPTTVILQVSNSVGSAVMGASVAMVGPAGSVVTPASAITGATGQVIFGLRLSRTPGTQTFIATTPTAVAPLTVTATATGPAPGMITTLVNVDRSTSATTLPQAGVLAHINNPTGLAQAADGTIYVAGYGNNQLFALSPAGVLSLLAGTGACSHLGDGGPATSATLCNPLDMALDETHGRRTLYVIDQGLVRAIDLTFSPPLISTVAGGGTATAPTYGDGGLATAAVLTSPAHLALEPGGGSLYVVDNGTNRIRKVDLASGLISTWWTAPGGATCSPSNCSGVIHDCSLGFGPQGAPFVAFNTYNGNIGCTGGTGNQAVYRVAPDMTTTLVAGGGASGADGILATSASLSQMIGPPTFDGFGNLYWADRGSHRVRRVDAVTGLLTTVAGTGTAGFSGELSAATGALLNSPWAILFTQGGDLAVTDGGNNALRSIAGAAAAAPLTAAIQATSPTSFAVTADQPAGPFTVRVTDGNGQPIQNAPVTWSSLDPGGALVGSSATITDVTGQASVWGRPGLAVGGSWRFSASAAVPIFGTPAGSATFSVNALAPSPGAMFSAVNVDHAAGADGFPGGATRAHVNSPVGIATAADGTVYFSAYGIHRVFALAPSGQLTVLAGTGTCSRTGDGGPAASATLCNPADLILDDVRHKLYVVESTNYLRAIDLSVGTPTISTFAGGGGAVAPGYGDGGPASAATLNSPRSLAIPPADDFLYFADFGTNRIRRIDLVSGFIQAWFTVPAWNSGYSSSCGLAFDPAGVAYVSYSADFFRGPSVIARVTPVTLALTVVAGGGASSAADGVPALTTALDNSIAKLVFSPSGDLYFSEVNNHRIRKVSGLATSPIVKTVIGTGAAGNGADFLAPTATALNVPWGIAFAPDGKLFITDQNNHTVRVIWPPVP